MINNKDNIITIRPEGKIDYSNSNEFKKDLMEPYNEGATNLIVDFRQVDSIDSSGLGKLLLMQKRLKERGGELKIINVEKEYIRKMFKMIYLNKIIDIEGLE